MKRGPLERRKVFMDFHRDTPWDVNHVLSLLPHRQPFMLIDKVLEMTGPGPDDAERRGRKVHALKQVTYNEPFFVGHFPRFPVMPGVLQLEAMAQACALVGGRTLPKGYKEWEVMIGAAQECKFRQPVVPGDTLHIFSEIIRDGKKLLVFDCYCEVEGKVVSEAQIFASMQLK